MQTVHTLRFASLPSPLASLAVHVKNKSMTRKWYVLMVLMVSKKRKPKAQYVNQVGSFLPSSFLSLLPRPFLLSLPHFCSCLFLFVLFMFCFSCVQLSLNPSSDSPSTPINNPSLSFPPSSLSSMSGSVSVSRSQPGDPVL